MSAEAKLEMGRYGLLPASAGWFVLNLDEAEWCSSAKYGTWCGFESPAAPFEGLGVNVHVLQPGQPACLYHRENQPEAFLVLAGECLLIVEEEERRLRPFDFFHCPPGTKHVFVGAGKGPCAILMIGRRDEEEHIHYPVSELAQRHGAGVREETDSPQVAYACSPPRLPAPPAWPRP